MSEEKKGIADINIPAEIDRVIAEMNAAYRGQDQFRSMKALMIYQAQLLEAIVELLKAPVYGGEKDGNPAG